MLHIDVNRCRDVGIKLSAWLSITERIAPEYILPPGLELGTREHACFLFFTANLDQALMIRRIRPVRYSGRILVGADALWCYSRNLTQYSSRVFLPETLLEIAHARSIDELTYFLMWAYPGLGQPGVAAQYWLWNAKCLLDRYNGDPRKIAQRYRTAASITKELCRFRGIGDKLSSFITRFMYKMGYWKIADPERVSIPADIHLRKLAFRTGMVKALTPRISLAGRDATILVKRAYEEAARAAGVYPMDLDEPAWHIARLCCSRRYGDFSCYDCDPEKQSRCYLAEYCMGRCPLSSVCEHNTSLELYYAGNLIDRKVRGIARISELEDLYPVLQDWLEQERGFGMWMADWPIDALKIDYVAHDEVSCHVVAIEGIINGERRLKDHLSKIRFISRAADEPYVATNDRSIVDDIIRQGLGVLLYDHDQRRISSVTEPAKQAPDPQLKAKAIRALGAVLSCLQFIRESA